MADFLAGQVPTAAELNLAAKAGVIVGWAQRVIDSNTANSTTDVAVLELPDVPLTAGRIYEILSSTLRIDCSIANDVGMARIRYTTDGSTPGVTSTVLPGGQAQGVLANTSFPEDKVIATRYVPASNETMSLLLCVSRQTGTGVITILADGANRVIELTIRDCGVSPGDIGIDR